MIVRSTSSCVRKWTSLRRIVNGRRIETERRLQEFELLFLGTGASNPSLQRNFPCTALYLGGENFLFDVGEGTLRQSISSCRHLSDTTRIFITHLHLDHVLGLPSVILSLAKTDKGSEGYGVDPVHIYGPQGIHELICTVLRLADTVLHREVIIHEMMLRDQDRLQAFGSKYNPWAKPIGRFCHGSGEVSSGTSKIKREEIYSDSSGLWNLFLNEQISVVAGIVAHRIPCFGFVTKEGNVMGSLDLVKCQELEVPVSAFKEIKKGFDFVRPDGLVIKPSDVCAPPTTGRKVCIIGDTCDASNPALTHAAQNCDILVHEATFDYYHNSSVHSRGHSTPPMAVQTALAYNARRLVLNHIGAKYYPFTPKLNDSKNSNEMHGDMLLLHQAVNVLDHGRKKHVILARDYNSIKVPFGGYSVSDRHFWRDDPSEFIKSHKKHHRNG